ncbi:hypothetical protein [Sulfurisoma sediminicola]|uniref:ParB-like nuclease family protein n=1 Tax=Sulfurisoma sediminicola TaxID=1381557 RepID=A0A497XEL5_9PROT|nr:hypothetical protein [Sulfurisoma sediminicola]RLJ64617.1 hypothetical protein DFR35_1258 [Sulfurisoma sediminicola]
MTDSSTPPPATTRFGWQQNRRCEELRQLYSVPPNATHRVPFQGRNTDIGIVRVPIELPKYRMANGRTASLQAEYLAKNPKVRHDLFSGDAELWDAQEVQHTLLLLVARQQDLQKYFEDTDNRQIDPILLDERGFVVNGNRRLSCWRELYHQDPDKYGHYRHIDVAMLPHCDEREIDRIEAMLQIQKDIKADYSWDAQANMLLDKQKRDGFSNKELADLYGMKESDVQQLFDMRSYADEYLRSRAKADMWSSVSGDELAFRRIVTSRQKISGVGSQELFKHAAFALLDNPGEVGDSLHDAINYMQQYLDSIVEKLGDEFPVAAGDIPESLGDLFGGGQPSGEEDKIPLAKEIQKPENSDKARRIIVEEIESQRQLKKDSKNAGYLLDCCTKAHAQLAAAVKEGLRPESKRAGVARQLDAITGQVGRIRAYLDEHAKD